MERRATSAFLLLLFLLQTFSGSVIVAAFYANQNYIARNLCENRDRPQVRCGGTCQLTKQLKRAGKEEEQNPGKKMDARFEVLRLENHFTGYEIIFSEPAELPATADRAPRYPEGSLSAPFHPPCI